MKSFTAGLLLALAIPAAAAPFALRSEVPISAPEYAAVRDFTRSGAHIATNGDGYLAVWTDSREGGEPSVYAARMRADGTVVDRLGLRIANGAHSGPVVWTGSKYLIAYQLEPASRAYVRTMTIDGVFGEPIEVGQHVRLGAMATNGANVLLVLSNEAMMLDLEGNKLRSVTLAQPEVGYSWARVAAAGSSYLVAAAFPNVIVQTVSTDGVAGAPRTLAQTEGVTRVGLASDGERFLVVWPDGDLYAQLVTSDGTPTGPVQTLAATANSNWPSVGWRDGEYFVVFNELEDHAHYGMRVAADGSAASEPKRIGQALQTEVDIVARGRDGIALFSGMRAALFDDASLAGGGLFRVVVDVAITARPQSNVHLARLGDGYVAAWLEDDRIFLSTAAGTMPVAVLGSDEPLLDVLVDRSNVIWVLWASEQWVAVTRFWPNLQPIDALPIYIHTPGAPYLAAAAGEGVIALAYDVDDDIDPNPNVRDVAALLLWETGSGIARKDVLLTTEPFADFNPAVAFDGTAFVYGWMHGELPDPHSQAPWPEIELVGARVAPNGDLLDAAPVHIAADVGFVSEIDAARGANGVAFAWQEPEKSTRVALFGGAPIDLGGPEMSLGGLAPHDGGFLLVRGISRRTPALTEVEYLVLNADLSIDATGALPPYEADTFWKAFDIDAIGGASPVFAYVKSANGLYGNVPRVFVRRTGEAPPRRRSVR